MKPAPEKSEQEAIRRPTAVRDLRVRDKSKFRENFANFREAYWRQLPAAKKAAPGEVVAWCVVTLNNRLVLARL